MFLVGRDWLFMAIDKTRDVKEFRGSVSGKAFCTRLIVSGNPSLNIGPLSTCLYRLCICMPLSFSRIRICTVIYLIAFVCLK